MNRIFFGKRSIYLLATALVSNGLAWIVIFRIEAGEMMALSYLIFLAALLAIWFGDFSMKKKTLMELSQVEIGLCVISAFMVISVFDVERDWGWVALFFGSLVLFQNPMKILGRRFR